ncbi:hypothetical protein HK405_010169, partial [Cladochytrium tenue]
VTGTILVVDGGQWLTPGSGTSASKYDTVASAVEQKRKKYARSGDGGAGGDSKL